MNRDDVPEKAIHIEPTNALAKNVLKNAYSFERGFQRRGRAADKVKTRGPTSSNFPRVYQFKVSLKSNPEIWRIIKIKENQMLSSLHRAIFDAFDRFDEHLYSFFMSNNPRDRENEYTAPYGDTDGTSKFANRIRIDSLYLHAGQKFLYLFDFGDQWWHEVEFIGISKQIPRGNYPRVVKKQGRSPPQYSGDE